VNSIGGLKDNKNVRRGRFPGGESAREHGQLAEDKCGIRKKKGTPVGASQSNKANGGQN